MSGDALKTCPECAEEVRAAALRCRFCGYRFDVGRVSGGRADTGGAWSILAGLFRRRRSTAETPYDLVTEWGVPLGADEPVRFFLLGHVSARHGYLVVTDRRWMFFEGRGTRYRDLHAHTLDAVVAAEPAGGGLRLAGPDYDVVVRGLREEDVARVRDHVQAYALLT